MSVRTNTPPSHLVYGLVHAPYISITNKGGAHLQLQFIRCKCASSNQDLPDCKASVYSDVLRKVCILSTEEGERF